MLGKYLARGALGSEGWIISMNNMEDVIGGHYWLGIYLVGGGLWHIQTRAFAWWYRGFTWSAEAYLGYSNAGLGICAGIAAIYGWYNNTAYASEFYGPTGPEASAAQSFTFLVRDEKLGMLIPSSAAATGMGKYLMRSPSGEIIFGGESMRFWALTAVWHESLRTSKGLDIYKIQI